MWLMKEITRTQTGVRLESRLLKVLKALATELDLSLGDLLEGIVLHAFEGKAPFSATTLRKVKALKRSEEHTSELQSQSNLVCRLLLEKKKKLRRLFRLVLAARWSFCAAARSYGFMSSS